MNNIAGLTRYISPQALEAAASPKVLLMCEMNYMRQQFFPCQDLATTVNCVDDFLVIRMELVQA